MTAPLLLGAGLRPLALASGLSTPMLLRVVGSQGDPKARLWNPPTGLLSRAGHNLQFANLFNSAIDWDATAADMRYGTGLIRWQSLAWRTNISLDTGFRASGWQGMYHEFLTDLKRDPADASVLTFLCQYNNYLPAPGQPFVLAQSDRTTDGGWVEPVDSYDWDGFAIPLRQKLTIEGAAQEGGLLRVRIRFPNQVLPGSVLAAPDIHAHHWNWYLDAAKTVRYPLDWAAGIIHHWCRDLRMHALWGGEQGEPTWFSDYKKVQAFGSLLVAEIKAQEYDWRATAFADVDPRNLAQAFENERNEEPELNAAAEEWHRDVNYPLLRAAMPDVTIVQGPADFKSPFSIANRLTRLPDDGLNKALEFHLYHGGGGFNAWDAQSISDVATLVQTQRVALGYDLALCGEFGVLPTGSPPDRDDPERGYPLGRTLTGWQGTGIPVMVWSMVGDAYWCAYPDSDGVLRFFPNFRDQCSRVGDTAM